MIEVGRLEFLVYVPLAWHAEQLLSQIRCDFERVYVEQVSIVVPAVEKKRRKVTDHQEGETSSRLLGF